VLVESRAGASGTIGAEAVAHAPADGYVLGISSVVPHAIAPATYPNLRYDPLREVAHIALLGEFPLALAVNTAGPFADLASFIEAARRQPGALRVGAVGSGGLGHIALEVLRREAGAAVTLIPFRGGTAAALETMGGRTEATMAGLGEVGGQDRLRLLALTSEARLPRCPDVPTFREAGIALVAQVWFGLCAPAGVAPAILARLEHEVRAITRTEGFAALLDRLNAAPQRDLDAAGMAAFVTADAGRWGEIARAAGIRAE
jgi:tripartite-type tricarboxylate transporter receptor subunit TctC